MLDNQTPENQMLNDEPDLDAMAEIDVEDEAAEIEVDDEPELTITIEGEEPEIDPDAEIDAELGDKGKRAIQAARKAQKETAAKNRALEAELAEIKAAKVVPEEELIEPNEDDFAYNMKDYAAAVVAYNDKLRVANAKKAAAKERLDSRQAEFDAKRAKYYENRHKVGIDDSAQSEFTSKMNQWQQSSVIDLCKNPEHVISALLKFPALLDELSKIEETHKFSYRLSQIERDIKVTQKTPPPPETKLRGGSGAAVAIQSLEKMQEKAVETGDYTAYFAEKRRRAAKA